MSGIITIKSSQALRPKGIDLENKKILLTDFLGSDQEEDMAVPPNCNGVGRVRHFNRYSSSTWTNPLPIEPALHALNKPNCDSVEAQVFQNAVCNWRCWYCFVDFDRLSGREDLSKWMTADEIMDLYLSTSNRAKIIDLSGGQPDLTPEWILWMMDALENANLQDSVYLWSDDNLSNDYFWKYLSKSQIKRIAAYPMYGRVGCFKGIDKESFSFNTGALDSGYDQQFMYYKNLLATDMDLYAYVTFTVPNTNSLSSKVGIFVDKLQEIDEHLPLRTTPLRVNVFSPVAKRLTAEREFSLKKQDLVFELWTEELNKRFSFDLLQSPVHEIPARTGT